MTSTAMGCINIPAEGRNRGKDKNRNEAPQQKENTEDKQWKHNTTEGCCTRWKKTEMKYHSRTKTQKHNTAEGCRMKLEKTKTYKKTHR